MAEFEIANAEFPDGNYKNLEEMCIEISENVNHPLSEQQSMDLVAFLDERFNDFVLKFIKDPKNVESSFLYNVIEKRIEVQFTFKMEPSAMMWLATISGTPGLAIMYLWYIQYIVHKNDYMKKNVVSLDLLCKYAFPMGILSEESNSRIWNKQKFNYNDRGSNMVDCSYLGENLLNQI